MPKVFHNGRRLESRRIKANGDDRHGSDLIYLNNINTSFPLQAHVAAIYAISANMNY